MAALSLSLSRARAAQSASFEYRVTAFNFAQCYLRKFLRPTVLPLSREAEGSETSKFWSFFEPPAGYRIDVKKDPARCTRVPAVEPLCLPFSPPALPPSSGLLPPR